MTTVTTDELIEQLVAITHGWADQETQNLYLQSLQALVELAKVEQRSEAELPGECRRVLRPLPH